MSTEEFKNLKESDKGRQVRYEWPGDAIPKPEFGEISSWNDTYVFVRFGDNASGHASGHACSPEYVTFQS